MDKENAANETVPSWIWHKDKSEKLQIVLTKKFTLIRDTADISFFMALTGSVEVELNGAEAGRLEESHQSVTMFKKLDAFPQWLQAGNYELKLRISCTTPMPISPVSIHLINRLVGFIAFLQGQNLWLITDDTWGADDVQAEMVCRLGEEPYGDLENGLDWFVKGGFGDIVTEKLTDITLISSRNVQYIQNGSIVQLSGRHTAKRSLNKTAVTEMHIFYHLLKQTEWAKQRAIQNQLDLTDSPQARIDLRKEYNARFRVNNLSKSPVIIWWNGAESIHELNHYDGCITESFVVPAEQNFVIQPQGMRYVQIFILDPEMAEANTNLFQVEIEFESVAAALEQVGAFEGDLPQLNQIYDVAVHTNRICHQLGLWDGIKRDRLNWAYDFYLAGKADYVLWKDLAVLKRSIVELGKTPYGYWMNSIPAYTLWWFNNLWEYFLYTNDREFIIGLQEDLHVHISWVESNIDEETGFLKERIHNLIEWVPMEEHDLWISMHGILVLARRSLASLSQYIPELGIDVKWPVPFIAEDEFLQASSLVTPLLGIAAGYVGDDRAVAFLKQYQLADPITPLSAFWLAECYSNYGMHEQAWITVSTIWGKMLSEDATTFWESIVLTPQSDFHDSQTTYTAYSSYRMSLCHSWASTPVQWVSRYILGVEPLEPGYAKIRFSPNAVSGLTQCRGTIGTPQGPINVAWKLENGQMECKLDAVAGIEVVELKKEKIITIPTCNNYIK